MKMIRMAKDKFFSYVLDERKAKFRSYPFEIYYLNPKDVRGNPSSFVIVVVFGPKMGEVYAGASKFNPWDAAAPGKQKTEFSLEEGVRQACNRVWREMRDMPSLYGRDHCPKQNSIHTANHLKIMLNKFAHTALFPPLPVELKKAIYRQKLLNAKPEVKHATKKPAHS